MKPTRTRLLAVAAALSTVAIAAPSSTASAAVLPGFPTLPTLPTLPVLTGWGAGWSGTGMITSPVIGPATGAIEVVGPTIITTAPSSFINTNNQVSAGGNWSGGQVGP